MLMTDRLTDDERNHICEAAWRYAKHLEESGRLDAAKVLRSAREKLMETFPVPEIESCPTG